MSKTAFLAFGSNVGKASDNINAAIKALGSVPDVSVEKVSSYFITKPWGYKNQNDFVNACARLKVNISPEALLGVCLGIEAAMGRERKNKNGPRIIDIDLIIYEDAVRNTSELTLPHPRYSERDFVLVPLMEVAQEDMKKAFKVLLDKIENGDRYIIKRL